MSSFRLRRFSAATSVALLLIAGTLRTLASEVVSAEPALAVKAKSIADAIAACQDLAKKDEKDLTFMGVVLAAGRVLQPDLNVAAIEKQIQEMADKAKTAADKETDAKAKVAAINRIIFNEYGFHTDMSAAGD